MLSSIIILPLLILSQSPPIKAQRQQQVFAVPHRQPRIAIIGSGAAGSSSAFFLSQRALSSPELNLSPEITIFERRGYVGGRSTVMWPYVGEDEGRLEREDMEGYVELGGSIFVDANRNLMRSMEFFNLSFHTPWGKNADNGMAIYDGEQFVYQETGSYWDYVKLFWRYGRSLFRAQSLTNSAVASFRSLYTPSIQSLGPFNSTVDYGNTLSLLTYTNETASALLSRNSVSSLFINELEAAATTVNYGQSPEKIHALGGLVSMATNGATSVDGGNRRIFRKWVDASGAELRLRTEVESVMRRKEGEGKEGGKWTVTYRSVGHPEKGAEGEALRTASFDAVILAAPYHFTSLKTDAHLARTIPNHPYVHLHVTMVITSTPNPLSSYFGRPQKEKIPRTVYGTFVTASSRKPRWNSLSYLKELTMDQEGAEPRWIVKFFSEERLEDEEFASLFGDEGVKWVFRKEWDAYPRLLPMYSTSAFAPTILDDNFYYVNAFEPFISTMETESVAAENVVNLLLRDMYGFTSNASWAGEEAHYRVPVKGRSAGFEEQQDLGTGRRKWVEL